MCKVGGRWIKVVRSFCGAEGCIAFLCVNEVNEWDLGLGNGEFNKFRF